MREVVEMLYLQETPVILDDRKLLAKLPVHKTPYDDGIHQTLEWMRGTYGRVRPPLQIAKAARTRAQTWAIIAIIALTNPHPPFPARGAWWTPRRSLSHIVAG
jgi:hypothetical protein